MPGSQLSHFLAHYTKKQVETSFPDGQLLGDTEWQKLAQAALAKLKTIFTHVNNKYYEQDFEKAFNYLHADHYAMFLYWASRAAYLELGNENIASKLFYLNKSKHTIDIFYKVELPDIFLFMHPFGTIIGNGSFDDFLVIYQGVTVGGKVGEFKYPTIGKDVTLYANSTLIGNCHIGNRVVIGANTLILSHDIPDGKLVTGQYPHNKISDFEQEPHEKLFHV